MSTSAQGKVVDGQGGDIVGLTIVLEDVSGLFERELGRVDKTTSGAFELGSYPADDSEGGRRLRLRTRGSTSMRRSPAAA